MIIKRKLFARLAGNPRKIRNIRYVVSRRLNPKGSSRKAAEKAVQLGRKAEAAEAYVKTATLGKMLADGVGYVGSHPVQTAASVIPVPLTSVWLAPPAEKAAQKFLPGYAPFTNTIKTKYNGSRFRRVVESAGNTLAAIPM